MRSLRQGWRLYPVVGFISLMWIVTGQVFSQMEESTNAPTPTNSPAPDVAAPAADTATNTSSVPAPETPAPAETPAAKTPAPTPAPAEAKDTTAWESPPHPTPLLDQAEFKWWASPDEKQLRGVLVVIPGHNGDARNAVDDSDWRSLAETEHFAIVGCRLFQTNADYQNESQGKVGAVMNKAISALAAANGHPYLKDPPIALWGMSAGGNTALCYATFYFKRVVAVADIKGTSGPGEYNPEKGNIPWLVNVGKTDKADWVSYSLSCYQKGKTHNALWTLALHPTDGHTERGTKPLVVAFLTAAIEKRMGPPTQPETSHSFKHISLQDGWLGDTVTYEIAPYGSFKGKKSEATWLIDENTAKAWQDYLKSR